MRTLSWYRLAIRGPLSALTIAAQRTLTRERFYTRFRRYLEFGFSVTASIFSMRSISMP